MYSIKEQLPKLVLENMHLIKSFSSTTYKESFESLFKTYRPVLAHLEELYLNAADKEAFINEIAGDFVAQVKQQYDERAKKSNKESLTLDYNMIMASFAIPCILEYRGESTDALADALVAEWNASFTKYKIHKGKFADIDGSFKRKLCFITTAVCDSLGKADDCYELTLLRSFRDTYMMHTETGDQLVKDYYRRAPVLVMRMNLIRDSRHVYDEINETYIKPCISLIEEKRYEECQDKYVEMVESLTDRFIGGQHE
ncbi:MAG: hypothetical protein PHE02_09855 [Lachnospiraceae bacterium]|nr:hypothetical protein [Lachnospiraceae bacterium]